ncbi:MAG: GlcG/HbpS family heme-binding protein [Rickettsiales bacterium]
MRTKTTLTASDAFIILTACKAEAAKHDWKVSIAVTDEAGYLLHLERLDGAGLPSAEIATLKARTAAIAKAPTKALEDVVKDRPAVGLMPGRLPVQGGVPIIHNGECVGGIGVSGVKSHEDEIVAIAGREALLTSV